jgi:RNA polymerase sigma-70 factor (ECF subfamily)
VGVVNVVPRGLAAIFLEHLGAAGAATAIAAGDDLEARLKQAVTSARAARPGLDVPAEILVARIAGALVSAKSTTIERGIEALQLGDLLLACACERGDRLALAEFERSFVPDLLAAVSHVDRSGNHADDVLQVLRQKLFVGEPGGAPKIREYGGRGELGRWLRAVAVRAALDTFRVAREVPVEDELLDAMVVPGDHPELAHLKRASAAELKIALREALAALEPRERTFLQQYYLDGARLETLATLYKVTPSTVSRSLAKARATLLGQVRNALMARLRISGHEVDSLLGLVQSQLELSRSMLDEKR